MLFQSQQDLSLDDVDDSSSTKDDQMKKSRFSKRLRSPDRSVWDASYMFAGDGNKNEIEKMFEKFKIKMAADDEDAMSDDHSKTTDGVAEAEFSPAHSEHSNLIRGVNKAYTCSVDAGSDGKKDGEKKKHKHKKDKREKDKKSRRSKSESKRESAVAIPADSQPVRPFTTQQSDDSVFVTASPHTPEGDVSCSMAVAVPRATSAELDLPSIHSSCHMNVGFSGTLEESHTDEVGSVDVNPLDVSTAELIPQSSASQVTMLHSVNSLLVSYKYFI